MFIKLLLLAALIRLLIATEKPFLCSGIYAGIALLFGVFFGGSLLGAVIVGGIAFGLASLYFWILDRLDTGSVVWWAVALGGLLIGLV